MIDFRVLMDFTIVTVNNNNCTHHGSGEATLTEVGLWMGGFYNIPKLSIFPLHLRKQLNLLILALIRRYLTVFTRSQKL